MSDFLRKLFDHDPSHESGNVHENARVVRDTVLNAMNYGVLGSEIEIPEASNRDGTKLRSLLQYSKPVLEHAQTLHGILSSPRDFQIVDRAGQPWRSDEPDGDVIYRKEGPNHVYYFAHHLTSPYLNPWAAAVDGLERGDPFLNVTIMQDNDTKSGRWELSYLYSEHDYTSGNNINSSFLYPERQMLLQFWFSKKRLSPEYIFKNYPGPQILRDHLKLLGENYSDRFRHINLHFEGKKLSEHELRERNWRDDLPERHAKLLEQRGDFDFSVVEIGTQTLGGEKHWVYTGSDVSRIEVKAGERVMSAIRKLGWQT